MEIVRADQLELWPMKISGHGCNKELFQIHEYIFLSHSIYNKTEAFQKNWLTQAVNKMQDCDEHGEKTKPLAAYIGT